MELRKVIEVDFKAKINKLSTENDSLEERLQE